jgi:hypothetical protein
MNGKEIERQLRKQARHGDNDAREFLDSLQEERRKRQQAVKMFAEAVLRGDREAFREAVDLLDLVVVDGWAPALARIVKLQPKVSPEIQNAFLDVWTESKMPSLKVGRHRTLARALHVLLPKTEIKAPVQLFRGAAASEPKRRRYGFSWSAEREVAERFVENNKKHPRGAVLLETLSPPEAIIHERENLEGYYAEREYIVDPYALKRVTVIARYPSTLPPDLCATLLTPLA